MSANPTMHGRICIVTGAGSGIGKATAHGLAEMGATVVMVCRNPSQGQAALDEIKAQTGNPAIDLLLGDLASQQSIHQFAAEFKRRYSQLHVLVNNAAVNLTERTLTVDGIETTFAVNHLAPYLLSYLLLDHLKASAPARIVNITSAAHNVTLDFDNLQGEKGFDGRRAYVQTKLANILFTYELAQRLQGTGVTVNCADPGVVNTNLGRDFKGIWRLLLVGMRPFMASPEQGAETPLVVASAPELVGVSGKYFSKKREAKSANVTYDALTRQRLWQISAELTHLPSQWGA